MNTKEIIRLIVGFIIGIGFFVGLVPYGLYLLSQISTILNPELIASYNLHLIITIPLLAIAVLFIVWSNIFLVVVGKGGPTEGLNVEISPATKKLVTTGPYKYSRNPMVFGAFCLYISLSILFNSLLCLICVALFFIIASTYLKRSEEKRLIKDFGEEYIEYKKRVSMIIPFIRKHNKITKNEN